MHPLIVTPLYPPAVGGAATYFGIVAPGLAAHPRIDRVTVLTERLPAEPAESVVAGVRVLRRLPTRIGAARGSWQWRVRGHAATQWWFATRFVPLARQLGADVIHLHTRYRGRLLDRALQHSRIPVIANLHDKLSPPSQVVGVADCVLSCAETVHRFVEQYGDHRRRSELIPLPLAIPARPSPTQVAAARRRYHLAETPYLLFVGDITVRKGVYDLLDGFRRWQPPSETRLVFAGTNWEGERFLRAVKAAPDVRYIGPVPHDDALVLMRGAQIVALPSHNEALPYVILEAIAMGTRVICPPGIPEFERHLPGAILPEVNAEAVLHALQTVPLQTNPPTYPLSEHSPERVLDALVTLYEQVVDRDGTRGGERRERS